MTLGVGNYLIPPLGNCLTLQGLSLGKYLIADSQHPQLSLADASGGFS